MAMRSRSIRLVRFISSPLMPTLAADFESRDPLGHRLRGAAVAAVVTGRGIDPMLMPRLAA